MKKFLIFTLVFLFSFLFTGCIDDGNIKDFEDDLADRTKIVEMIERGELKTDKQGLIELPKEYKSLSDSGQICITVATEISSTQAAIYFWTFRGPLESSKGYVYLSDKLSVDDYTDYGHCFTNIVDLGNGWYSCSTDD